MGDNVKLKDIIRNMKEDISAKMLGKDKLMEELVGKARRYKKECEEQGRQLKRLEAKLVCQVVAQESLLKGNELDDELAQLERELQQLENQQDAGVGSAAE